MAKRLFLAVNLPEEIKEKIKEAIKQISRNEGIRFIPSLNWHLTISFLGYQKEELVEAILKSVEKTINRHNYAVKDLEIEFEKIILAPPGKKARMIWLVGTKETSKNIFAVKSRFENILIQNGVIFKKEYQLFNSHLTLARFHSQADEIDLVQVSSDIAIANNKIKEEKEKFSFFADKLDLMESKLHKNGPSYNVVKTIFFNQNNEPC